MWALKEITEKDIEPYERDYCRRARDLEPLQECSLYGTYFNKHLVSYFAVSELPNDTIFIRRGYVLPQFRATEPSGTVWKESMKLLEQAARAQGFRNIEFYSTRNPTAYSRMFNQIGFKIKYAGFVKHLGD